MIYLYIEVNNQALELGILQKAGKKLFLTSYKTISLLNSEVVDGVIFNSSYICSQIYAYIQEHNLKNPKALISVPQVHHDTHHNKHSEAKNSGKILQAALCFSKTPIKIEKIITESLLTDIKADIKDLAQKHILTRSPQELLNITNQLSQFYPSYSIRLDHWLVISCVILSGLGFGLAKIYAQAATKIQTIHAKNTNLAHNLQALKEKTSLYPTVQEHKNDLIAKIADLTYLTDTTYNPTKILLAIGENIPETCWLTGITIKPEPQQKYLKQYKQKQKEAQQSSHTTINNKSVQNSESQEPAKKQNLKITIRGTTPSLSDTTGFVHSLSSSPLFKNLTLVQVKKLKNISKSSQSSIKTQKATDKTILYAFTISAVIEK